MKHKHYDLIVAWAGGAEIEVQCQTMEWRGTVAPSWSSNCEYRIKPKPPVVRYGRVVDGAATWWRDIEYKDHNIKATFDGETGELLSVEKI